MYVSAGSARGTDDTSSMIRSMVPATAMARCIGGIICGIEAVCCFGGNIRGVIDASLFIIIIQFCNNHIVMFWIV